MGYWLKTEAGRRDADEENLSTFLGEWKNQEKREGDKGKAQMTSGRFD